MALEDVVASRLMWTLEWWVPCLFTVLYLSSQPFFITIRDTFGITKDSPGLKYFIFLHNVALMVFSGWVMVNVWPLVFRYASTHGYNSLSCDVAFWKLFGKWAIIFYASKYWEFMDTWILVIKGKNIFSMALTDPTGQQMLQVYHHTGVALTMYLGVISESNWLLYITCLNSTIHTVMYAYYAAATLGYKSPYAKLLTKAQIAQFIVGIAASCYTYMIPGCLDKSTQLLGMDMPLAWIGIIAMQSYAGVLIILFYLMFKRKYEQKMKAKREAKSK